MCEKGKEIKFCTCVSKGTNKRAFSKQSKNKENKENYTWTLDKYIGYTKYPMDGMLIYPEVALSEAVSSENIVKELNNRNCFDFDYNPNEGDNLQIFNIKKHSRKHLSFIFRNGTWVIDSYNSFTYDTEKIYQGCVAFE